MKLKSTVLLFIALFLVSISVSHAQSTVALETGDSKGAKENIKGKKMGNPVERLIYMLRQRFERGEKMYGRIEERMSNGKLNEKQKEKVTERIKREIKELDNIIAKLKEAMELVEHEKEKLDKKLKKVENYTPGVRNQTTGDNGEASTKETTIKMRELPLKELLNLNQL